MMNRRVVLMGLAASLAGYATAQIREPAAAVPAAAEPAVEIGHSPPPEGSRLLGAVTGSEGTLRGKDFPDAERRAEAKLKLAAQALGADYVQITARDFRRTAFAFKHEIIGNAYYTAEARRLAAERKAAKETARDDAARAGDQAASTGRHADALGHYLTALQQAPLDASVEHMLREKVIRIALSMDPRPAVPEEAVRHSDRGQAFVKQAADASGYAKAVEELKQAVALAPWWADAYYNLGLTQEKGKDYAGAIGSLKLYLAAAPKAADAPRVKKKIIELEVSQELTGGPSTPSRGFQ